MTCAELLATQAYLDNELDAPAALTAEQHIRSCQECAQLQESTLALRTRLRSESSYYRAPAALQSRVARAAATGGNQQPAGNLRDWFRPRRQFAMGALGGMAATALAASLAFVLLLPPHGSEFSDDLVAAHVRSLIGTHLIDVASSNHHTVKPWFGGRSDISPPVGDFSADGFRLVGGRMDYVNGRRAAVVIYRHGAHVVNVFVWKDEGDAEPGARIQNGYEILSWKSHGLLFCAVSDTDRAELKKLSALIQKSEDPQE